MHKRFFGNESRLLFTSATESVVDKHYRMIGQLPARAILHLGISPHGFHPSVINYMFYIQVDNDPQFVDHGELMKNISQIESGNNNPLHVCAIYRTQDKSKYVLLYKQHFHDNTKVGWNRTVQTRFTTK